MPSERYAVGVDLGGSKLRGGILSEDGRLAARLEMPTEAWKGPTGVLANLKSLITRLLSSSDRSQVAGIGIAAAGQIHPKTKAVVYAPNLGWNDVPLRDDIESAFQLPTSVENDVRAAAWGEYRFGVGRGAQSLIAVFVGTGVGSGAVVDGILLRGFSNAAGEVGHTQIVLDGVECACGQRGCVEAYASGRGLARRLESALAAGVQTSLAGATGHDPSRLTASMVAEAASTGDGFAREIWWDAERYLGMALADYVTLLNPELLVLGGGIIDAVPSLHATLVERVRAHATVMARDVRVERAALGDSAGIIGAADQVWAAA
ncbi:MAG TPA: ROK family protein [Methylomirabilota bacterium]|jgi:glucokinase|nr:ROK family protein [Methylomirabilota bacterium]